MSKTLKDLWYGNIDLHERFFVETKEYKKAKRSVDEYLERLEKSVTKETMVLIEELLDAQGNLDTLFEADAFVEGFRLGSRMMAEVYSDRN